MSNNLYVRLSIFLIRSSLNKHEIHSQSAWMNVRRSHRQRWKFPFIICPEWRACAKSISGTCDCGMEDEARAPIHPCIYISAHDHDLSRSLSALKSYLSIEKANIWITLRENNQNMMASEIDQISNHLADPLGRRKVKMLRLFEDALNPNDPKWVYFFLFSDVWRIERGEIII